jgi:PAS domain S-box-containing protein
VSIVRRTPGMQIMQKRRPQLPAVATQLLLGIAGLALTTFVCFRLGVGVARTGFIFVILVALVSLLGSLSASVVLSVVAAACLNYFFTQPLFDFRIDLPEDIERIAAFLAASLLVAVLTTRLRASEARFRSVVEHATDGFFLFDEHQAIVDVNKQACESLGYSREEMIGMHPRDFDAALDQSLIARIGERINTGETVTFETLHRRKDGTVFPAEVRARQFQHGAYRFRLSLARDITERKRAEEVLRESEARLQKGQRIAHFGWWERDFTTNRMSLSDEVCRIFGLQPVDLPEWHGRWLELIHPEDRSRVAEAAAAALLRDGKRYDVEYRVVRPDGTERIVHSQGDVTWDESGTPLRQFGVLQDITELRRTAGELRESEKRFRSFVDHAMDGFYLFDEDQAIVDVNRQACESLGYSREEIIGMHPGDFEPALDKASIERIGERIKTGETVTFETLHRRKDGTVFPVEVRARQFEHGGHRYRLSLARDVTERKRAEEALRRNEYYLAEAQRLSHTGTIVFNAKGPVYWSEESYRIWNLDPRRGLPDLETVLQRIHPDDREIVNEEAFAALRQKRKYAIQFRIVLPDGTIKYFESTGHPLLSADGEPEIVATHIDVTERKRAQAEHERLRQLESELAHMNRLSIMGELTASLAHEILHPVATARNNARSALRFLDISPVDLGEVREALECVVRDTDRGKDIVSRIREHIKKAPPRKDRFDINAAISEVIVMVQSAIDKNSVSVSTRLMEGLIPVQGDRVQLQQVVLNLVLNAVEAMSSVEGDRQLLINTEQNKAGGVLVAVRDSGPGIDPEQLDRVFEPFYTTKTSGVGMGLSICRSIIGAHGGRLWVDSHQGGGAVFQFTLPTAQEGS